MESRDQTPKEIDSERMVWFSVGCDVVRGNEGTKRIKTEIAVLICFVTMGSAISDSVQDKIP